VINWAPEIVLLVSPLLKTTMTLTQDQYDSLLSNYVDFLIDGMDMDSLIAFASEQLEMNVRFNCLIDEELIEEISRFYDESEIAAMLENVGANPADFNVNADESVS
jgi:hypothetical protein